MIPVATREQVRALDRRAIEELGIPGVALMETASRALALGVLSAFGGPARASGVLLVCGGGNNGGDGFGAARWLHGEGIDVAIWALSEASTGDAAVHRRACERLGLRFVRPESVQDLRAAGVVVDALFGTGLSREIGGAPAQAIAWMNECGLPVVSADLPSGIDADTGRVYGTAVQADRTITFGAAKPGLYTGQGPSLSGCVVVDTLGLGALRGAPRIGGVPEPHELAGWWPQRSPDAHKTRSGHLGVVAGSTAMAGAAVLCCRGALAAGAGLVTLVVPRGALPRLAALPPEVMVLIAGDGDVLEPPPSTAALDRPTAWVLGPGLGGGRPLTAAAAAWIAELWRDDPRPMLADADALTALPTGAVASRRVITPHPGEAARMLDQSVAEVQGDRFQAVQSLATDGRTALLKGPHTLIASRGQPIHVNTSGGPVLATAGSGDVLAGVIGALLAVHVEPHRAATLGAWVHGMAGEHLAQQQSVGWTAGDVADAVPHAVDELLGTSR